MASTPPVTKAVHEDTLVHSHIRSPLYWIFVTDKRFGLIGMRVKKPQQPKGQGLVKAGFMLRQMLTKLVEEKIERPQVYAFVVDGYECATYKMMIDHQSIFKLIEIKTGCTDPNEDHKAVRRNEGKGTTNWICSITLPTAAVNGTEHK
ncbi:hypothetical protein BJV82DRAFT_653948 [Fennellomyces sp. T-0311]|nr:hypothetical protein BJV82DRAFT_653948 [Fennellomyces sp. T-0311]